MTQPAAQRPVQKPQASAVRYKAALRKSIRRNFKEPDIDFLNITAMLDMMTIILVFLLKNMTASNAAPPQNDDFKLPKSVMIGQPKEDGIAILVSKTQILVGDDPNPVVSLPSREALAQSGVDARFKRGGPNDLYIVPLGNALQSIRQTDKQVRKAKGLDDKSEAIVICDATTPYRLFLEVLFTLGQSEFGKFHLMVLSGTAAKLARRSFSFSFASSNVSYRLRATRGPLDRRSFRDRGWSEAPSLLERPLVTAAPLGFAKSTSTSTSTSTRPLVRRIGRGAPGEDGRCCD
jgi:biopolymer transport protein ExbD